MDIKILIKKIKELKDLKPSSKVNNLFRDLVNKAIDTSSKYKLSNSEINEIQRIAGVSEFELEKYWAKKIIKSNDPFAEFNKFPYLKNYQDLTKLEWNSLKSCDNHSSHNILFVGGGPLPMTAIVLALKYGLPSTVIDIDDNAIKLSKMLLRVLNLHNHIKIIKADAQNFSEYSKFNTIFVAALAGMGTGEKKRIYEKIKQESSKGTHLIARSSWGNRKMLYKPISKSILKLFKPVIKVDPFNEIVNSVLILKND